MLAAECWLLLFGYCRGGWGVSPQDFAALAARFKIMKSYKNIYPKIYDYRNLYHSWRKAARGKRKAPEVAEFEYYLLDNLLQLEEELRTQTYQPGPYRLVRCEGNQ